MFPRETLYFTGIPVVGAILWSVGQLWAIGLVGGGCAGVTAFECVLAGVSAAAITENLYIAGAIGAAVPTGVDHYKPWDGECYVDYETEQQGTLALGFFNVLILWRRPEECRWKSGHVIHHELFECPGRRVYEA